MRLPTPSYNYTVSQSQTSPPAHNPLKNQPYPVEITKNYMLNQSSYIDYFNCKYCRKQFVIRNENTIDQMIWHSQTQHGRYVNAKRYSLEQRMDHLRPPPKYLSKYQHLNIISDRWLDRLILDDYPINKIKDNIFLRLTSDSGQFMRQAQKRTNKIIAAKQSIIQFLPRLPLHFLPEEVINLLRKRFNVSLEGAGLFMKRYTWPFVKTSEMYQKLNDINVDVRRYKQNNIDCVVVLANQRMKLFYEKYGDSINLQFRFIPLKRSHSGMHYNIGLFTGQDTNLRSIIFGIALLNGYYHKNVKICIQFFLEIMGNKSPEIFITDHSKMIEGVLNEIRRKRGYKFKHIVNWYYSIQKLKIELANEFEYRQNLSKFSTALSSISNLQYDQIIRQIKNNGRINHSLIAQFQKNSYKCCICKISPVFVGFGVQEDRVLAVTQAVEQEFQYHNRVGMSLTFAFRLEHSWNQLSMRQTELTDQRKIFTSKIKEIRYLGQNLEKNIFTKFFYLYNKSLTQLQVVSKHIDKLIYRIHDKSQPQKNSFFYVHFDLNSNCWRCSCTLIYWSGIPCEHLIKIVRLFKGSISYYINSRWFINGIIVGKHVPEYEVDPLDNSHPLIMDNEELPIGRFHYDIQVQKHEQQENEKKREEGEGKIEREKPQKSEINEVINQQKKYAN